ncbi:MAG: T9SS type A sorting domain-containing protein, partial [bacterium]|nr:T9SS type A sorting domain-containing protein [bacterium]
VFAHEQAADLALDLFVGGNHDSEFAGSFAPVQVEPGSGPIVLPRGFFDALVLTEPLPTQLTVGTTLTVAGTTTQATVDAVIVELVAADGETTSFGAAVENGRFTLSVALPTDLEGDQQLRLFTGVRGVFFFRGGFNVFVGGTSTAVTDVRGVDPSDFALTAAYPNPFNATTVLPLQLAGGGWVEVAVFGLNGQRLMTLHRGWLAAGVHQLRWHGVGADGRPAASGVYLVRAAASGQQATHKVMLLR